MPSPSSLKSWRAHLTSKLHLLSAENSASVESIATDVCNFDFKVTRLLPTVVKILDL